MNKMNDIHPSIANFKVTPQMIEKIEKLVDKINEQNKANNDCILPPGTNVWNSSHLAKNEPLIKINRDCPIHGKDYLIPCPVHGKISYKDVEVQTDISTIPDVKMQGKMKDGLIPKLDGKGKEDDDMVVRAGNEFGDNALEIQKLTSKKSVMSGLNIGCKVSVLEKKEIPTNFTLKNSVITGLNIGCGLEIMGSAPTKPQTASVGSQAASKLGIQSGLDDQTLSPYSLTKSASSRSKKRIEKTNQEYEDSPVPSSVAKGKRRKSYSPTEFPKGDGPLVNFIRRSLSKQGRSMSISGTRGTDGTEDSKGRRGSEKIQALIQWPDIKLSDEVLGKGQFGVVVKGTVTMNGKPELAAVKTMQIKSDAKAMDALDEMWKELNVMSRIGQHPNVVRLFGACEHDGSLYVAMELLTRGDLKKYLRKVTDISLEQKLKFCYDIASGMEHISSRGFIHRDLAARNILLTEDLSGKVSDFGLSRLGGEYMCKSKNKPLPVRWMPPEAIQKGIYTEKSDVWSYGVTVWEIFTGCEIPYRNKNDRTHIMAYIKDGNRLKQPHTCPDNVYALMKRCWNTDPNERPTFKELKQSFYAIMAPLKEAFEQSSKGSASKMSEYVAPAHERGPDYWDIIYNDITFPETLGPKPEFQGKDLIITLNKLRQSQHPVSALCTFYSTIDEREEVVAELAKLRNEINILKGVPPSNNIIKLFGSVEHSGTFYTIFEVPTLGRLKAFLVQQASKGQIVSKRLKIKFCTGICEGLRHLQKYKVIHRDVSARNIFLDMELTPKLGSFGNARNGDIYIPLNLPKQNPVRWMALECIRDKRFTEKSDVWAFGVTCWEIWIDGSSLPFEGTGTTEMVKLLEGGERLKQPPQCPDSSWAIIKKCWNQDVKLRPTFKELCLEFESIGKDYTPLRSWYIALKSRGISLDSEQKSILNGLKGQIRVSDCFHDHPDDYWMIKEESFKDEDRILLLDKFQRITTGKRIQDKSGQKIDKIVAIRNILPAGLGDTVFWDKGVIKELDILKYLPRHNNILQYYGSCHINEKVFLIEEWAEMGELKLLLNTVTLTEAIKMNLIIDICHGMQHLTKFGLIHRDLGARSIKVARGFVAKITKLKVAQRGGIFLEEKNSAEPLPVRWLAPENISHKIYTERSDVWAYGILIWEIFTDAKKPYGDVTPEQVIDMIHKGERLERPPKCPINLYALMLKMWDANLVHRPTFNELAEKLIGIVPKEPDVHLTKPGITFPPGFKDEMELPKSKVEILSRIRKGDEFTKEELWLGRMDLKKVLVRILRIGDEVDADHVLLNNSYNEINIMKIICPHVRITNFLGYFTELDKMYMIKDYYPNGDLRSYLREIRNKNAIPKPEAFLPLCAKICEGMIYLTQKNVIHRNLSTKNINLDENLEPVIDDFSRAVLGPIYADPMTNLKNIPFRWLPLESLNGDMVYSEKSDVWSFGVTVWEVFSFGSLPYGDVGECKDIIQKLESGFRLPCPPTCPPKVHDMVKACWLNVKEDRPTFQTLLVTLQKLIGESNLLEEDMLKKFSIMTKESGKKPEEYWIIPWNDIKMSDKQLGKGNFGQVKKATLKRRDNTRIVAAIKMIKSVNGEDDKSMRALQQLKDEVEIMKALGHHRNIIRLYGYSVNQGTFYMAMECAEKGNLKTFLETRKAAGKTLPEANMIAFINQICNGMDHMARCQVIHRDLACRNILLDSKYECKISDFGLARKGTIYIKQSSGSQLPVRWMAMECFTKKIYSEKTDVWAFGVLIWEIYTYGNQPYEGKNGKQIMESLEAGTRLPRPPSCSLPAYELMRRCWDSDPDNRKSFAGMGIDMSILCKKVGTPINLAKKPWYKFPCLRKNTN